MTQKKRLVQQQARSREQIWSYFAHQMSAYPRLFVFGIFIYGDRARILRVDRAGATATTSFYYKEEDFLAQFLYRYSQVTDIQRGWDPTASTCLFVRSRATHSCFT
ncbi:hypothetical protein QCA50_010810 [Cerrena zonata]|uniref:Uncharacterized protein n=1 Tax=Cerrena zonata TaxID=2478898 RepID=A0AAW0G3U6_9APHY